MVSSHLRQFLPWLGAKRRDLKEEKNSLKRSGKHSDDQEDTLKKTKVDDAPKTAIPSGRGPMIKPIKLSQPVPVSRIILIFWEIFPFFFIESIKKTAILWIAEKSWT